MTATAPNPPAAASPAVVATRDERTIRLGDLGVARENLRHGEPPDDDIPTLAATLKAAGQLQPVTVRPGRGRKEEKWMALDGRRRRLALGLLVEAGDIDADYPVKAYVETDPARQAAAVLLTNTAVPVHVADVIAAVGRMLKTRLTVAAIARALGYAEIEIRRLAALADLPPAALQALKIGRMTLKQARLLARLPDKAERAAMAEAALEGGGVQDWRLIERLDAGRVTARDRRCALVDPDAYAAAGGRTEIDLFGELTPVLLDPGVLSDLWMARARGIAAVFEAEGIAVHVTVGPDPELDDDLDPIGYAYGGRLSDEAMARYRAQCDVVEVRAQAVRRALEANVPDAADLAIVDMVHARIAADQTGCGDRVVTTMVMRPASGVGVEVRCYTPFEPEIEHEAGGDGGAGVCIVGPPTWAPPVAPAPAPDLDGVGHALHAVRTDVATRGLIRALADDPAAALTALIARLFTVLVLRPHGARSEAATTLTAVPFDPAGDGVVVALDGDVRRRLDARRADLEASEKTVIAWVHALPREDRAGLLAELVAISLDLREARTTLVRPGARAEAAELAALCEADITRHWTPDATFLTAHPKGLLIDMLGALDAADPRAAMLRKSELVDQVATLAGTRRWVPPCLSWRGPSEGDEPGEPMDPARAGVAGPEADPDEAVGGRTEDDGAGVFVVTPAGEAALRSRAS